MTSRPSWACFTTSEKNPKRFLDLTLFKHKINQNKLRRYRQKQPKTSNFGQFSSSLGYTQIRHTKYPTKSHLSPFLALSRHFTSLRCKNRPAITLQDSHAPATHLKMDLSMTPTTSIVIPIPSCVSRNRYRLIVISH